MQSPKKPGLDNLSLLISGKTNTAPLSKNTVFKPEAPDRAEEKLLIDVEKVITFAQKLAGDNIFDVQVLIETCAEELRENIRDMIDDEEEE